MSQTYSTQIFWIANVLYHFVSFNNRRRENRILKEVVY